MDFINAIKYFKQGLIIERENQTWFMHRKKGIERIPFDLITPFNGELQIEDILASDWIIIPEEISGISKDGKICDENCEMRCE